MNTRTQRAVHEIRAHRIIGIAGRPSKRRQPRMIPPRLIEVEYGNALAVIVARIRPVLEQLERELPALLASAKRERAHIDSVVRTDAGEGRRVRVIAGEAREKLKDAIRPGEVEALAEKFAQRTATHQRIQFNAQTRSVLGVDVFQGDKGLASLMEGFAVENAALITNIGPQMIADIEKLCTRAIQDGRLHADIAKDLERVFQFPEKRARLIARDQVGKFYGQVNAQRQKNLGVERFVWRTVGDERVRDEHEERNGQTYSYSDPPDGELPGEPILCRCYGEPVLDDILAALD